jgi:hypothetical protein
MKAISKVRFDALAGYSRTPWLCLFVEEYGWFEDGNEKVLGVLAFDLSDEDYDYFVLGRDTKRRFRTVAVECSIETAEEAQVRLETRLALCGRMAPEEFAQATKKARR